MLRLDFYKSLPGVGIFLSVLITAPVIAQVPNDPLFAQQSSLSMTRVPQAWVLSPSTGGKVRIAVLDSGYSAHPDINWTKNGAGNIFARSAFSDVNDTDSFKHGSHVAGVVGASTNNGVGVAGVCPQCDILAVKAVNNGAIDAENNMAFAIQQAVQEGARVVNLSVALPNRSCSEFPRLVNALAVAEAASVSVVASAGNYNPLYANNASPSKVDVSNVVPASCPNVISVGATDENGQKAPYSNDGASLTIMAPGGGVTASEGVYGGIVGACSNIPNEKQGGYSTNGILSTWTHNNAGTNQFCYRYLSGTSMSAPHVAGIIGLMVSASPSLSPSQVRSILRSTATPMSCTGNSCGSGLVNAEAAVAQAKNTIGNAVAGGPCRYSFSTPTATSCTLDSFVEEQNGDITVTAYGRTWRYGPNGNMLGSSLATTSSPSYSAGSGPCSPSVVPGDGVCVLQSRTVINYPGFGVIDSITARGMYWNYDAAGNMFSFDNVRNVPRYANNICIYAGTIGDSPRPAPCNFDTRSIVNFPEFGGILESITAYGRYFLFDGNGASVGSGLLSGPTGVARYSAVCQYKPTNQQNCVFDTRVLKQNRREVITAYGRYFEFSGDVLVQQQNLKDMQMFQ